MDESQCQNFWATNSEFWFIPVPFVGSEKREAKIGVLERSLKSGPGNSEVGVVGVAG